MTDKSKQRWEEELGSDDPFGAAMHGATIWRAAEARLLASHIEALRAEGGWEWRDIVLLLRATTSMGFYERALEERGIPTHVVGGRGYWAQQQVADLRHWLAALANPRDELAVYSMLSSPLAGLSLDAVALIGLHARETRRDVWWTVSELNGLSGELPDRDRRRLERFVTLFEAERRSAPQVSLETLIHRAISETGYDRHVLSLPAGGRRMANVRKLMRMAREYEAEEGRDLRGFIDTLAERDAAQPREGEAPLEAEALDAVRLMTIHRAKGLEFPVVCVGDVGKDGREDYGSLRISDDGSLGLRLASIGGGAVDSTELERIKAQQKRVGEEEEKRIFYVAVTRAQQHLVLSGATDLESLPPAEDMKEPMRWMLPGFAGEGVRRIDLRPGNVEELLPASERHPTRPEPEAGRGRGPAGARPGHSAGPARAGGQPPLVLVARGLPALLVPLLPRTGAAPAAVEAPFAADARAGRGAGRPAARHARARAARGSRLPPAARSLRGRGGPADREPRRRRARRRGRGPARDGRALRGSDLCRRIAGARRVRLELPFAFTLTPPGAGGRSLLLNGVVDVHAAEDSGLLVVDYKSDVLDGRDPVELTAGSYSTQRLVYALAGLRSGAERVEVVHCYLERPGELGRSELRDGRPRSPRGRAAGAGRRSGRRPLRAHRSTAPRALRRLPGPSRPVLLERRAHARGAPARPFRQVAGLVCDQPTVRNGRERGRMSLCFIEPQEAIRVVAESVGREARRQLLGEVVRAWVDEIPDDELTGPLRQGRRRTGRRRPLHPRRVARVARGGPADRQQGLPARRLRPLGRAPP